MWFKRKASTAGIDIRITVASIHMFARIFLTFLLIEGQNPADDSYSQDNARDLYKLRQRRNSAPAVVFGNEESMILEELEAKTHKVSRIRTRRLSEVVDQLHGPAEFTQSAKTSSFLPSLNWLNWISYMRAKKIAETNMRFLIPNKLAFISVKLEDLESVKEYFQNEPEMAEFKLISSQMHKRYWPLCADFGPVGLSIVHRFCRLITKALTMTHADGSILVYYIEPDAAARANASFLLAAYLLLCAGFSPHDAASPFLGPAAPFALAPFRDASYLAADYPLTLTDCMLGLHRAVSLGWYDVADFDAEVSAAGAACPARNPSALQSAAPPGAAPNRAAAVPVLRAPGAPPGTRTAHAIRGRRRELGRRPSVGDERPPCNARPKIPRDAALPGGPSLSESLLPRHAGLGCHDTTLARAERCRAAHGGPKCRARRDPAAAACPSCALLLLPNVPIPIRPTAPHPSRKGWTRRRHRRAGPTASGGPERLETATEARVRIRARGRRCRIPAQRARARGRAGSLSGLRARVRPLLDHGSLRVGR